MLVAADAERRYVRAIVRALGGADAEADAFADAICEADLRGYTSHGLLRVADAIRLVRQGVLRVGARPRLAQERPAAVLMDGDHALGPYATVAAMREAMARARRMGTASVALYDCGHIGAAGYYVELAARADLIGLLVTRGNAGMHPYGGVDRQIGTNPLAVAIPSAGEPFLLDMAASAISLGALREALARGEPIAPGLAVDAAGRPTTDPAAALAGALAPFGGAKGYGLGLVVEVLGGLLTGAGAGTVPHPSGRLPWGVFAVVIDPAAYTDPTAFKREVGAYFARLKTSRLAPGAREVLIPGERAFRLRREQLARGVQITDAVWAEVAALARTLGVEASEYVSE
ncbi:MAG TPA: Ldh family oxidoreductase [Chloroflexota bacterium]|nr:Ldh family oxidoreductase [Chloroflexota bacterium]